MVKDKVAAAIHITGIVQGVGFRPFVFSLAENLCLSGWVRNTAAGVDIDIEGSRNQIDTFIEALWEKPPPLAHIDDIQVVQHEVSGYASFKIVHSQDSEGDFQPISPDVSICEDCLRELFDPQDRRYRYPFINCTNCGPRFTIIRDLPYDRPNTTMSPFGLCNACASEYRDPRNRRFHAQPTACAICGPRVWLCSGNSIGSNITAWDDDAVRLSRRMIADGKILAIKGLGGFHLACDATNPEAVAELRRRKLRVDKAFAVMMPNIKTIENNCLLGAASQKILESHERPVVILERRSGSNVSEYVAPGQNTIGVMLPYTPLHHLIIEPAPWFPTALVMTSGNLSEEPIAISNEDALTRLNGLADAFLLHNREIQTRCDDSVVQVFQNEIYPVRRSRGYAPYPIRLEWNAPQILATGAELKNTFCLVKDRYAFLSHHIGDLENYETYQAYEQGIKHFENLFRIKPEFIAHDLHPDYLATQYAVERSGSENLPTIPVQHHHAHIAACMAEHHLVSEEHVIGVSFDGTGLGDDMAIWGGEFLVAGYRQYERVSHLNYVRLPGGDLSTREPWRIALSWLDSAGIDWDDDLPPIQWVTQKYSHTFTEQSPLDIIRHQITSGINSPLTSSVGRLFDTVASLIGLRSEINYEAQAAVELEAINSLNEFGVYPFEVIESSIDFRPAIRSIVNDYRANISQSIIATRFHNTLALVIHETCRQIRSKTSYHRVVLSGGVWQNKTLLSLVYNVLKNDHFDVFYHKRIPTNDGGIALGQAAVALHRFKYKN
jgi:hydrogenase maturation protein HypF